MKKNVYLTAFVAALSFASCNNEDIPSNNEGNTDKYINDSYYYAIFDSEAKTLTRIKAEGKDLPWSTGKFNNYIANIDNTFYLGLNSVSSDNSNQAYVYSLNIENEEVKKSFSIDASLDFLRMYAVSGTPTSHIDLWLSVNGTTSSEATYVARVDDPTNVNQTIDIAGKGVDVTGKMNIGAIQRGGYYYFATEGDDGLVKYKVNKTSLESVGECPYGKYIFKKGKMTGAISASHEWIGDNILLLSQYNTTTKKHIWAKFDTQTMKLLGEGEFDLHEKYPEAFKFSTSGHIRYRKSDGKLLLFTSIHYKGEGTHPMTGAPNTVRGPLAVVVIDEKTMKVEETLTDDRVSGLALEAYGDTQQEKAYFDENGDMYLICLKKGSKYTPGGPIPECVIIRMKNGEKDTDRSYLFEPEKDTDILVVRYLKPGKAIFFVGDHERYYNGNK